MTLRDVAAPAAGVTLLFAGFFKGNPLLSELPVDLTLAAAGAAMLGVAVVFIRRRGWVPLGALPILLLWSCFVPGWFLASENIYAAEKPSRLFTLTLLSALIPAYLITTRNRQGAWLWLHVLVGLLVILLGQLSPSVDSIDQRFALEGSNTIAAGRATGAGLVVLMVFLYTRGAPRVLSIVLAALLTVPLVQSGSRGPVAAVLTAALLVAATSPAGSRTRLGRLGLTAAALVSAVFVLGQGGTGSARIRRVLVENPLEDASFGARVDLWHEALLRSVQHPWGVGWGDFYDVQQFSGTAGRGYTQYAHNVILETLIEGGWLAAVGTALFVGAALARLRRAAGSPQGAGLYGIAIFTVVNAMVSGDVNDNRMLWASLAFAWVARDDDRAGSGVPPAVSSRVPAVSGSPP